MSKNGLRPALVSAAAFGAVALAPIHANAKAMDCAALAGMRLPNATITSVETVAAGAYTLPGRAPPPGMNIAGETTLGTNPAFCRLSAILKPSPASHIRMEIWLPASGWNGKFLGLGNFGWGGGLMYPNMLTGVRKGYAVASNDTGHDAQGPEGPDGKFSLGQPEKMIDYGYRANHEMTVHAKNVVKAFYGAAAKFSYMVGCSLGGLHGLIEAKRYPTDYDGIVAGAPPNPIVSFNALQLWPTWNISQDRARLIPREKYAAINEAVLQTCATAIGRKQGFLEEPDRCGFQPAQLLCKSGDAPDCLTAPQVELLRATYTGPVNPRTGQSIFVGPAKGSEREMYLFASGEPMVGALDMFRYFAFQNADWNWQAFDYDRQLAEAAQRAGGLLHVDDNLSAFLDRGGKMLMYVGWSDYHNPVDLMRYHDQVAANARTGGRNIRLFAVPGMGHCAGGPGCDTFDKLDELDAWVTKGAAPERIVASRVENGQVVRTRPICAYPKVARYKGAGDETSATSFDCVAA